MEYLVSVKENMEAKPSMQRIESETGALNLARRAMLAIQPIEETSADLKAMRFLEIIKEGSAGVIENTKLGTVMVFQVYNG